MAETDSTNKYLNNNLYGLGLVSQGGAAAASRQYLLEDGMGNTRFLTDSSGNMIRSIGYDPYGNQRTSTGNGSTKFKFDQQWVDTESNLYYLRARYYDSTTGSFTSKDPVTGVLTDPQTQNGYNYTGGNPINFDDPSGEQYLNPQTIDECIRVLNIVGTKLGTVGSRLGSLLQRGASPKVYDSFDALKKDLGPAGAGNHWHHVVEQSKVGQFGSELIHNTNNVKNVPADVNLKLNGYYSSIRPFTNGQTVREWLSSKSYAEQMQFGLEKLREFSK